MLSALALGLLLQASNARIVNETSATGVNVASITDTAVFRDMGRAILKCYHHTAHYRQAWLLEAPWEKQREVGGDRSALLRIGYRGATGQEYSMMVGVVGRQGAIKAQVLADNARARPDEKCALNAWQRQD